MEHCHGAQLQKIIFTENTIMVCPLEFWNWLTALLSPSSLKLSCFRAKFLTMESWLILIQSTYCRYADQIRPPYQFIVLASLIKFGISYNLHNTYPCLLKRGFACSWQKQREILLHIYENQNKWSSMGYSTCGRKTTGIRRSTLFNYMSQITLL